MMILDWLAHNAAMVGLLFFFLVFCGITVWVMLPQNRKSIEAHKFIPLTEQENG